MPAPKTCRRAAIAVLAFSAGALVAQVGGPGTYAAFSDRQVTQHQDQAGAGVWAPDPPAACGPVADYPGGVVYGTVGDDVLYGGNQAQILMGLAGDDDSTPATPRTAWSVAPATTDSTAATPRTPCSAAPATTTSTAAMPRTGSPAATALPTSASAATATTRSSTARATTPQPRPLRPFRTRVDSDSAEQAPSPETGASGKQQDEQTKSGGSSTPPAPRSAPAPQPDEQQKQAPAPAPAPLTTPPRLRPRRLSPAAGAISTPAHDSTP